MSKEVSEEMTHKETDIKGTILATFEASQVKPFVKDIETMLEKYTRPPHRSIFVLDDTNRNYSVLTGEQKHYLKELLIDEKNWTSYLETMDMIDSILDTLGKKEGREWDKHVSMFLIPSLRIPSSPPHYFREEEMTMKSKRYFINISWDDQEFGYILEHEVDWYLEDNTNIELSNRFDNRDVGWHSKSDVLEIDEKLYNQITERLEDDPTEFTDKAMILLALKELISLLKEQFPSSDRVQVIEKIIAGLLRSIT